MTVTSNSILDFGLGIGQLSFVIGPLILDARIEE
ncbi:hypothetical protein Ple7327_2632 [Pleurocapsa sp. PCC 7327]|nr:hypothetical protein Ple7327_2632 [Pleurocapsa sp. PCC 7327]